MIEAANEWSQNQNTKKDVFIFNMATFLFSHRYPMVGINKNS